MEAITGTIEPAVLARLLWRRKWRIALGGLVCGALALIATSGLPTRYSASGLLLPDMNMSKPSEAGDRLTQSDILRSPTLLESTAGQLGLSHQAQLVPQFDYPAMLMRIETWAWDGLRDVAAYLNLDTHALFSNADDPNESTIKYLKSHLTIGATESSRVLKIGFDAGTPELAAAVVNELMHQYIAHDVANQRNAADSTYQQLVDRAAAVKQDAEAADWRVQQFQQRHSVPTLQAGSPAALQLNAQQAQLATAKLEAAQAQIAFDTNRQSTARDGGATSASGLLSSPALQTLSDRETDVLQRIARAGKVGSLNPARVALDDELRTVRAQIEGENRRVSSSLARDVDMAKRRVAALQRSVDDTQANANTVINSELTLGQLTRESDSMRTLYQGLLARAEDARAATAQLRTAQIVSPAAPPLKRDPSRSPMIVVLGFIGGGLLTATSILLRNLLRAKVSSAKRLAYATGMPGLGSLPHLRGHRRLSIPDLAVAKGKSPMAETLRGMLLTMQNMGPLGGGTSVLITSAESGEGKTTVAASLARRAAGDGMRVLLIEADLRRPNLSRVLGLPSIPNIEAALLGHEGFDSMIQTDARSGLHCLVACGDHPNPMSLLASERFGELMAYARKTYDLIVIDSPPALRVSDPILLSRWADVIVFAVRADDTAQSLVVEGLSRFPEQCQPRVVTLLTRAPITRYDRQGYFAGYSNARDDTASYATPKAIARPHEDPPHPASGSLAAPSGKASR